MTTLVLRIIFLVSFITCRPTSNSLELDPNYSSSILKPGVSVPSLSQPYILPQLARICAILIPCSSLLQCAALYFSPIWFCKIQALQIWSKALRSCMSGCLWDSESMVSVESGTVPCWQSDNLAVASVCMLQVHPLLQLIVHDLEIGKREALSCAKINQMKRNGRLSGMNFGAWWVETQANTYLGWD